MTLKLDLTNRETLVESLPKTFETSAEIGVSQGTFSLFILQNTTVEHHVCVDPWEPNPQLTRKWEESLALTKNRLKLFLDQGRCDLDRAWSPAAASDYEDEYFDFIYIDGDHTYEAVRDDAAAWWEKLKSGGVIAGHDYGWEGVKRAVDEFALERNLTVQVTGVIGKKGTPAPPTDGNQPSWVITKGETDD
jgi:predicted O-methyltransferase YrrM